MARDIPTLTTDRLLLRPMAESDLDGFAQLTADAEIMGWLGGEPIDREETWRRLAYHLGHWQLRGFGHWALELRETGEFLGNSGLYRPEGWPGVEVGWTLGPAHWGNGYATEAARAAIDWGWRELELDRIVSVIRPDNERSTAVARRLGMTDGGEKFCFRGWKQVVWTLATPA